MHSLFHTYNTPLSHSMLMMKDFFGNEIETIDNDARNSISAVGSRFKFTMQGQLPGLVSKNNCLYLIVCQRLSVNATGVYLAHRYNDSVKIQTVYQDGSISIATNSMGTIECQYGGSRTNVIVGAIELR